MKLIIPIILFIFVLIFSCKKKEESPPPVITTTGATTGATAGTTTGGGPGVTFNSVCSNQKTYGIIGASTFSITVAQNSALFTSASINNFSTPVPPYLNAGNISLNAKVFKNILFSYTDTTNSSLVAPFVWIGTGSVIPAFTVTNSNSYATYADYIYWPDTISKSTGFNVSLSGAHYADEIQVLISKSGSPPAATYTALVSAGNVSISNSAFTTLLTSTTAVIQCNFYKNNIQTAGTNQINFRNVTTFIKTVPVKN